MGFFFIVHVCHSSDTTAELEAVQKNCKEAGAFDAVICHHWAQGGAGAAELGKAVENASKQASNFKFLYDLKVGIVYCLFL